MPGKHAKYSPSSSHLWLNCPVHVDRKIEETNIHAERGSYLHNLVEKHCLGYGFTKSEIFERKLAAQKKYPLSLSEIKDIIITFNVFGKYINKILEPGYKITYEKKVKMPNIIQGCWGTSDINVRGKDIHTGDKLLIIGDWKFGRTLVDPDADQLIQYAIGGYNAYKNIDFFICAVLQPQNRRSPLATSTCHRDDIEARIKQYKKMASKNLNKNRKANIGAWCGKFASCKVNCPEYREDRLSIAQSKFKGY